MLTHRVSVAWLALAALFAMPGEAAEVYRCVGADGTITFSDQPCAEGAHQERREVTLPATGWDSGEIRERSQPLLDEYDARQARQRAERQAAEEQALERRQAEEAQRQAEEEERKEGWFFGQYHPYTTCPDGRYCPPPPPHRPGHWPGHWPPPPRPPHPPAPPAPQKDDRFPPNPRAPMSIPRSDPSSLY